MALTTGVIIRIQDCLTDVSAGNDFITALTNSAAMGADTLKRLVIAMGDTVVATNIQAAILGTQALTARDVQYMFAGFDSAKVVAEILTLVSGGVTPYAANILGIATAGGPTLAAPTFSPVAGAYGPTQTVTISGPAGADLHYTTDGTQPSFASTLYTGTISVAASETIKAVASKANFTASPEADAAYVINGAVATPTFSPVAGSYTGTQTVTVSSATSGATFHYTTDGSTPTTGSTLYSGPISVAASETLKVIGNKTNFSNSAIGTAAYVIS